MARSAPVTIDDVDAALRSLEDAGLKPTVRLVHQKLGRGSMSTITAHLRAIAIARAETDVGELPDPVLASLRAAADAVWAELAEAADSRIATVTAAADTRVRDAERARDTAKVALADVNEERGTLVATLAERERALGELGAARDALATQREALERQAALDERDRAALAARLDDRDAELQRALTAQERADAALAEATAEREHLARALEAEAARHATHETALGHLRERLEAARKDAAALTATEARLEAQRAAEATRVHDLTAQYGALRREHDAMIERLSALDSRLERTEWRADQWQRIAQAYQRTTLAFQAHVERLHAPLHAAGIAAADIPPPPPLPVDSESVVQERSSP